MTEFAESRPQRQILAIVYTDGIIADRFIANLGYFLRNAGLHVAGLVQHNHFVRDRRKCNMEVEELASGTSLRLSEFRGNAARGCRLDRAALGALGLRGVAIPGPDCVHLIVGRQAEAAAAALRQLLNVRLAGAGPR